MSAENRKRVRVVVPHEMEPILSPQGQQLIPCITQGVCGTQGLSAGTVVMPPARASRPHLHERSEIIVVCVEGFAATLVGPELKPVLHGPGEFIFIPEGVIHAAVNLSGARRLIAFEARTDPHFNDDVVVLPELQSRVDEIAAELQQKFDAGGLEVPERWAKLSTTPYEFPK